jgi:hypothetical protein
MAATFSIESTVQDFLDRRDTSADFLGLLAGMYGLSGCSQSRISQALRGARPFGFEHESLRTLVLDLDAYCESVAPIPVALKRPAAIKQLLDEFRAKKQEEQALIRPCYVIEFNNHTLFQGFVDGECRASYVSTDAVAIKDEAVANAAAGLLNDCGKKCRPVPVRRRTTEARMARTLKDLGFTTIDAN